MTDEEKKEYEELKSLLYTGTLSQYGKRKLIEIIEKQSKEIEEMKKQLDLDNECEIALNNKVMDLEKENEKLNKLHIQDNKHLDFIMKHSVPIQKVKDKIEEIDEEIKVKREIAKNPMDRVSGRLLTDSIVELEKTKKVLQSLLEKE